MLEPEVLDYTFSDQAPTLDTFARAKVLSIVREERIADPNVSELEQVTQTVLVRFVSGSEQGSEQEVRYFPKSSEPTQLLRSGDTVVVMRVEGIDRPSYIITDRYRLDRLLWGVIGFFILVVVLTGFRGVRSLLGLAFSVGVIAFYMVPRIMDGAHPLWVSFFGSVVIACVTLYLAHGFHERTSIALASTLITISVSLGLAFLAVRWSMLFGSGTEEAVYAQVSETAIINLQGLLLGGIIVGVMGILDDITTAQAAVVDELKKVNKNFRFAELYRRGFSVGREHISSLINTLALAYVGASLPLLLLFQYYQQPLSVILNSERIAEEVVRTLVGSTALVLAVPITTALAAWWFGRKDR